MHNFSLPRRSITLDENTPYLKDPTDPISGLDIVECEVVPASVFYGVQDIRDRLFVVYLRDVESTDIAWHMRDRARRYIADTARSEGEVTGEVVVVFSDESTTGD